MITLSAQHVRKTYGSTVALADASLELKQGEILALLGPNGAGKTTLIKILATLLNKDGGHVEILNYDLDKNPTAIRHLFGYVGQDTERSAYARLNIVENLRFFGALRGLTVKQVDQKINQFATYFEFHDQLDKLFMHLSGGQKQTVVIMRALLHDPPIIYLDEPTKGLDPFIAQKIRNFLKQYVKQENKSLLLTSHILSEVDELADRVALIHQGTIPITGTPQELKAAIGAEELLEINKSTLPVATQEKLLNLAPVLSSIERDPQWLSLKVTDMLDGTEAVIQLLRQEKIHARFRHVEVSLEDAFIHHVGILSEGFEQ